MEKLHSDELPPGPSGYGGTLKGQLDLFSHSRAVIVINDLIDSLVERNTPRALAELQRLRAEAPGHPELKAFTTLCDALEQWPAATTGVLDAAALVQWLDSEVTAAALRALGSSAEPFMRPLWRELATTVTKHAFDPARPNSHCVYCYLRAGDPAAALSALTTLEGYERNPFVLQWTAVARHRTAGRQASRAALFTLAFTAPGYLPDTFAALADPAWQADWERFWFDCAWLDPEDATAASWFPAWYLIEHPTTRMEGCPVGDVPIAPPGKAFETLGHLLGLEPGGYQAALVAVRAELRGIDERLFRHYMRRREVREAEPHSHTVLNSGIEPAAPSRSGAAPIERIEKTDRS